MHAELWRILC